MNRISIIGGAALVALLALAFQTWRLDGVRDDLAQRERDLWAANLERDQARMAEAVAEATASRIQKKAEEYDTIREALLRGDKDAPLPDWFRSFLFDLGIGVRADD